MLTVQISQDRINGNFFELEGLDDLADYEFLQLTFTDAPDVFAIAQKFSCVTNDGTLKDVIRIVYRSDKDLYPIFYYAVGRMMYNSLMYFRHLPIGKFNRFRDNERFNHELSNIKICLYMFSNTVNEGGFPDTIWVNPENPECAQLVTIAKELQPEPLKITEIRKELFDILYNRIKTIEELYKKKKFKRIRDVGYELHNVPEMIWQNEIFKYNFTN